jgi:hypothetical protein
MIDEKELNDIVSSFGGIIVPSNTNETADNELKEIVNSFGGRIVEENHNDIENLNEPNNQEFSWDDRALQAVRGAAKTYGGFAESVKDINPVDMAKTTTNKILERQGKPLIDSNIGMFGNVEKAANTVNEWAGKDLTPTDSTGQMLETFGEFAAPLPIPGGGLINSALWAAPITAGAQILKEMGFDENSSNAWASVLVPLMLSLGRKGLDYGKNAFNEEYRQESALGEASDFLKEKVGQKNVPKVIENIDNFKNPFPGELGTTNPPYQPNTAEIADNVGLSQYHRAKYGNIPALGEKDAVNMEVLKRELNNQASTTHTPEMAQEFAAKNRQDYELKTLTPKTYEPQIKLGEAIQGLESGYKPTVDEVGKEVQDYLHGRMENIREMANKISAPRYRDAYPKNLDTPPTNAFIYIDEELKNWSKASPINRDLRKAKMAIENAKNEMSVIDANNKKAREATLKRYKDNPELARVAASKIPEPRKQSFNVGKLDRAKQEISAILESVPIEERNRRRILTGVLDSLEKDLETVPEIFEARQIYKEIMEPANFIEEHQILGSIVKKDSGYLKNFIVPPSDIPKRVLNGNKSIDGAKALMDYASGLGTKEHREVIGTIKSYINSDILGNIVKENGHVDLTKLNAWKESNPGAFILYPELEQKLSNLNVAQKLVDRAISQNKMLLDNYYKKSMQAILGSDYKGVNDADKIASRILNSKDSVNKMEEAVKLLSHDKSGDALEGLKRGIVDDFTNKFKSDNFTYASFNSYLNKNRKALEKIFNEDQLTVMDNIRDTLKRRAKVENAGRGSGSDTAPKFYENAAEKVGAKAAKATFGASFVPILKDIDAGVKTAKNSEKVKYLEQALIEPEFAKKLLEKEQKTGLTFFEALLTQKGTTGDWLRQSNWNSVKKGIGTAFINYQKARMADGERD